MNSRPTVTYFEKISQILEFVLLNSDIVCMKQVKAVQHFSYICCVPALKQHMLLDAEMSCQLRSRAEIR